MGMTRRLMGAAVALGLGVVAASWTRPLLAAEPFDPFATINRIKGNGVLKMPVMTGEEPGYIKDPQSGAWSGYYIDWAKDIASYLGVELEYVETTWGNLAADFQATKVDLAIGLNPNPRRGLVVDYVPGYLWAGVWAMTAAPDFAAKSWAEIDRKEVRIAVQQGSTMQVIAEKVIPNATITVLPSRDQALLELQSKRVDAILLADSDALLLDTQGKGKLVIPEPILYNPATIGIRREAGNQGYMNFLANWMTQQRELGFARAKLEQSWAALGMDLRRVPIR